MEPFAQLGADLEEKWRRLDYNEEQFPALAADALRAADLPSKVSAWDVIEWTLRQSELPTQMDPTAKFGDPPITLFVGPRFYIDVYFWFDGTTAVHQHGFCGAFQVLHGSSIHSCYEFDRDEAVNAFIETGEMRLKVCELLMVGDVQEIRAGRQYIHSLFHLDQPSATIVVRTEKSPLFLPQFSYQKPSIAVDPFFEHQTTSKKLQSLAALFRARHPGFNRLVTELLETSDFQTSFIILSNVHTFLGSGTLGRLFNLDGPADEFRAFLEIVERRHGAKAERLSAVFLHRERENEIIRRRGYVTDPEHRFFLALVLNVDGRDRILTLIQQRFPGADPISRVLDWTYDLAQTRVVGVNTPNALGIDGFDHVDISLLENLLHGRTEAEAAEVVINEYGSEKAPADTVREKLTAMRESVVFQPLLSADESP